MAFLLFVSRSARSLLLFPHPLLSGASLLLRSSPSFCYFHLFTFPLFFLFFFYSPRSVAAAAAVSLALETNQEMDIISQEPVLGRERERKGASGEKPSFLKVEVGVLSSSLFI